MEKNGNEAVLASGNTPKSMFLIFDDDESIAIIATMTSRDEVTFTGTGLRLDYGMLDAADVAHLEASIGDTMAFDRGSEFDAIPIVLASSVTVPEPRSFVMVLCCISVSLKRKIQRV